MKIWENNCKCTGPCSWRTSLAASPYATTLRCYNRQSHHGRPRSESPVEIRSRHVHCSWILKMKFKCLKQKISRSTRFSICGPRIVSLGRLQRPDGQSMKRIFHHPERLIWGIHWADSLSSISRSNCLCISRVSQAEDPQSFREVLCPKGSQSWRLRGSDRRSNISKSDRQAISPRLL